jgi:hypothetical protein
VDRKEIEAGFTSSWLSATLGVDPVAIEARRRSGELVAYRPEGESNWVYPAWQFGSDGDVRPEVQEVLARAREAGVRGDQVFELLASRVGMTDDRRLADLLLAGELDAVLARLA